MILRFLVRFKENFEEKGRLLIQLTFLKAKLQIRLQLKLGRLVIDVLKSHGKSLKNIYFPFMK